MSLIVTTPAASQRLTSLTNARLDLRLPAANPSDDLLNRWIDQASGRAAKYCERAFGRQIYRERILSIGAEGVLLRAGPVNRIISVSIQGGATYAASDYLLDDGKLTLTYGSGVGMGDGSAYNLWRALQPALMVDYEAGWVLPGESATGGAFTGTTPLPAEIEKAVTQLIGATMSESGRDPMIRTESNEGVGSVTYYVQGAGAGLPHPGAEAALQPYRVTVLV